MLKELYPIALIVRKDYQVELRGHHSFMRMISFALSLIFLFHFVLLPTQRKDIYLLMSILWVIFIFTAMMGINRLIFIETALDAYRSIFLAPIKKSDFIIGKIISGVIFVFLVEIIIIFFYSIFFEVNIIHPLFFMISLLGTIGLISLGVLLSFISITTSNQEFLLSIILFPLILPLVIPCIKASINILSQPINYSELWFWLAWLLVYNIIFGAAILLFADFIE